MSLKWLWSSPGCGISGTEILPKILFAFLIFALLFSASAEIIQSGADIQAAVTKASPGDTIIVGPGQYNPFEVDKPLEIKGVGMPYVKAAIQKPGIAISSDSVKLSGFRVEGVVKDENSKFEYYMANPTTQALRLDLPNAAIMITGNDVVIQDTTVFGSQVGAFLDGDLNPTIRNVTFKSCDVGVQLNDCQDGAIIACRFLGCNKAGLDIEQSLGLNLSNNQVDSCTHSGIMVKDSTYCNLSDNSVLENTEGLALWNSSYCLVKRNYASQNYYGILVSSSSNNNTVIDNRAEKNLRSEIISGFGIGISLQGNSSYNIVARNNARKNFNGLELTKGCQFNAIYSNNCSDNTNGIRLDKNRNNLVYHNNFIRNAANAYDNASKNIWNTTVGNYYSDYRGRDKNGDGIGDQSYAITKGDSKAVDQRPLAKPCDTSHLDISRLKEDVLKYARFGPDEDSIKPFKMEGGVIKIEARRPTEPPKWTENPSYA